MAHKLEKRRRRLIFQEIQKREQAEAEAAMPLSKFDLKALFEFVESRLGQNGCDCTLRATRTFLRERGLPEEEVV